MSSAVYSVFTAQAHTVTATHGHAHAATSFAARSRSRRVAYICADSDVPVFGRRGGSVHVQEIIRAMRAHGLHVTLFAASIGGDAPPDLRDLPLVRLPESTRGDLGTRERAAMAANADLRQALLQHGPFDLLYERYALWSDAGMVHAAACGIAAVLEVNAPLIDVQAQQRGLVHRAAALQIARSAFRQATSVVAVSDAVAAHVRAVANGPVAVHVVPNGVNTARFHPGIPATHPARPGVFTVGFVGALQPEDSLPTLVRAFATLHSATPNVRLLIVGDGDARERMTVELAQRGALSASHFTGAVDPLAVPGLLASMDVAIAPYGDASNHSPAHAHNHSLLKLYEYMAAGVPLIASGVAQVTSVIRHEEHGLLVAPDDDVALADAITRLRNDALLRERLARAGRQTVARERSWEAVLRRTLGHLSADSARQQAPDALAAD